MIFTLGVNVFTDLTQGVFACTLLPRVCGVVCRAWWRAVADGTPAHLESTSPRVRPKEFNCTRESPSVANRSTGCCGGRAPPVPDTNGGVFSAFGTWQERLQRCREPLSAQLPPPHTHVAVLAQSICAQDVRFVQGVRPHVSPWEVVMWTRAMVCLPWFRDRHTGPKSEPDGWRRALPEQLQEMLYV